MDFVGLMMNEKIDPPSRSNERILVLDSGVPDVAATYEALTREGFRTESCRDMADLCGAIANGAGAAVIAEESMSAAALEQLVDTLSKQAAWSDFPLIILTSAESKDFHSTAFEA